MPGQQLALPTNRTVIGPRLRMDSGRVIVEYDFEQDDGSSEWSQIVFDEVLTVEYRQISCCREDDIAGAMEIQCLCQSEFLYEILKQWQKSVGWQEWQQNQGGSDRFKHFRMFFDDGGCINVIATSWRIGM